MDKKVSNIISTLDNETKKDLLKIITVFFISFYGALPIIAYLITENIFPVIDLTTLIMTLILAALISFLLIFIFISLMFLNIFFIPTTGMETEQDRYFAIFISLLLSIIPLSIFIYLSYKAKLFNLMAIFILALFFNAIYVYTIVKNEKTDDKKIANLLLYILITINLAIYIFFIKEIGENIISVLGIGNYKAKINIKEEYCKNINFNTCEQNGTVVWDLGKYLYIDLNISGSKYRAKIPTDAIAMEIFVDNKSTTDRNKKNVKPN